MPDLTYDVISCDSHVIEPPDIWSARLPARYRDRGPRTVHEENTDVILCDETVMPPVGLLAPPDRPNDQQRFEGRWEEDVPRGGYDPQARLADLERDGVDAEVLFPTLGMRLFPIEDRDFQWALFRAYNDWIAETFVQPYPERWKAVAMVNAEDVEGAIAELQRTREMGLSGIMLALEPGDDAPYWDPRFDPLWAACVDHEVPIHLHLTTTRKKKEHAGTANRMPSPGEMLVGEFGLGIQSVLVDMIHFGVFDRFPELTLVSVESDAGWASYLMEAADYRWTRIDALRPDDRSKHEPSHYFHQNIKMTIMRDRTAILAREIIGIESMMWGSDFPHQTSTWPNSKAVLDELLHDQPQEVRDALVRDNVRKLYHF